LKSFQNQTNQTLKRIRVGDSTSYSQNTQQMGSQRLNTQQIEPQRSNAQRPNANQGGLQRVSGQPLNSQAIQNLSRVTKPSQQSNKSTNQGRQRLWNALNREGMRRSSLKWRLGSNA